jgi:superfamily II DNA or RNA helicase
MTEKKGFIKIPDNKLEWLPLLRDLYRFEETSVSGPGSHKRRFTDVIWTKSDAISSLNLDEDQINNFNAMLDYLAENRQLMIVPSRGENEPKYLTRVAELVRTIGHTYEYWSKGRPAIFATRWLIEDKKVPNLVIPAKVFVESIKNKCQDLIPGDRGLNLCKAAEEVCIAVAKSIKPKNWEEVSFSEFQLDATLKILDSRYGTSNEYRGQVLAAGVGSGKTIAFSIATLIEARKTMLDGMRNNDYKSSGLFIYPRTQLAIDQHQELEKFASFMECELPVWLELSQSYSEEGISVASGVPKKYSADATPIPIIVTTFETLKRRMRRPEFMIKLSKHLSTIVLDEIHLLSGISGGMSSHLLSRLAEAVSNSEKDVHWIGASATIARPDEHGSRLFGLKRTQVQVISPRHGEMIQAGINHHIFIRPTQGMSLLGALVNVTSLTLHHRRVDLSKRSDRARDKTREKSIGFADNLEMLGRWNDDLRENERVQQVTSGRQHPSKGVKMKDWGDTQREIPYAWRFNKPLQRRLVTYGGNDEENPGDAFKDLRKLFDKDKCTNVCDSCRKGEKIVLGEIEPEDLFELRKLVYRTHHRQDDKIKAIIIDSDEFKSDKKVTIGTHEMCPFLQAGACAWFPEPDTETVYEIPDKSINYAKIEFAAVARSSVFSAKTSAEESEEGDEKGITSKIFRDTTKKVFDIVGAKKKVPIDIILASPSLEVGVDIPMLTESILVKAVRNIASYRQKVGRVGRERNLDTVNITLMTESNVDLHYYRQPRKLVSEGRLEPVPLVEHNKAIIACSAYCAIWEWLALHSDLPEYINGRTDGSLGNRLQGCLNDLQDKTAVVEKFVENAINNPGKYTKLIREASKQVQDEIELLLLPVESTYNIFPELRYKPTVIDLFGIHAHTISSSYTPYEINKKHESISNDLDKIDRYCEQIKLSIEDLLGAGNKLTETEVEKLNLLKDSLKRKLYPPDELNEVIEMLDSLDQNNFSEEQIDAIEDCNKYINRLNRELKKVTVSGINNDVVSLYNDYINMNEKDESDQYIISGGYWKRVYLSDTMDNLSRIQVLRRNSWFLRPSTMFENPYTEKVTLSVKSLGKNSPKPLAASQAEINISEAIFAFLPGSWNYRIPHRRFKVVTGELHPSGGRVIAKLDRLIKAGNKFRKVHNKSLPAPPGSADNLQIHAPTHLTMIESFGKYLDLNKNTLQVMDKDESTFDHPARVRTKLPKSFQNRWAWSQNDSGKAIGAFCLPEHIYQLENPDHTTENLSAGKGIKHPICNALINSIEWFDEKEVIEYTYGLSRSFAGKGVISLGYKDSHDRSIGFGEKYNTQAIGFDLNNSVIQKIKDKLDSEIVNNVGKISPSMIKCFKAFVLTDTKNGGATIDTFTLDDLISALLIFKKWKNTIITPNVLAEYVKDSINNELEFKKVLEKYIRKKMKLDQKFAEEDIETFEPDELVNSRVSYAIDALKMISDFVTDFDKFVPLWIHRTILSTFGVVATNSMQQFCGSDDNDISYLIEDESWNGEMSRVIVYDRAEYGNGSCATARDYLHIPHVIRTSKHSEKSKLPSSDYLSTLEENLLQCIQHQSDMGALVLIKNPDAKAISSMPDLIKHAKENNEIGKSTWGKLEITSMDDAWTLPLHVRLAAHYDSEYDIPMDDTIRSCTICWNGCPECVDQLHNALGGMLGMNFVDKYVLDDWFHEGVVKSNDYQYLDFKEMSTGSADMHFGNLNRLHLVTPENESKRSICLPWTMGFHIQRKSPFNAQLLIRSTDISDLRIGDLSGPSLGIEGHGFERLLWFNLLMTSHLDAVGALPPEKKELQLLYYDARDIQLKDVGLSPRMLDTMLAVGDGEPLEKLSDVLRWMLKRDFKITLCVDKNQATNKPVRDFLKRLKPFAGMNILQRESESGSMHKKMLISPIAAMTGSANLTYSGSNLNDESLSHVTANNVSPYESILASARSTLRDATTFDFNYARRHRPNNNSPQSHQTSNESPESEIDAIVRQLEQGSILDESRTLEFKSCYEISNPERNITAKDTSDVVFREVASMLNSDGGHVIVGVVDGTWDVIGIDSEISSRKSRDGFLNGVSAHFSENIGEIFSDYVRWDIRQISGKSVLIFSIKPSREKKVWFLPKGQNMKKKTGYIEGFGMLFIRTEDHVRALIAPKVIEWSELRFGVSSLK